MADYQLHVGFDYDSEPQELGLRLLSYAFVDSAGKVLGTGVGSDEKVYKFAPKDRIELLVFDLDPGAAPRLLTAYDVLFWPVGDTPRQSPFLDRRYGGRGEQPPGGEAPTPLAEDPRPCWNLSSAEIIHAGRYRFDVLVTVLGAEEKRRFVLDPEMEVGSGGPDHWPPDGFLSRPGA